MIVPLSSLMGDTVTEMGTLSPFFLSRTVSKWSTRSPARILARMKSSSWRNSSGMRRQNGSAYDLIGFVAKDSAGSLVPASDDAVQVFADDRIIRHCYDCRQEVLCLFGSPIVLPNNWADV